MNDKTKLSMASALFGTSTRLLSDGPIGSEERITGRDDSFQNVDLGASVWLGKSSCFNSELMSESCRTNEEAPLSKKGGKLMQEAFELSVGSVAVLSLDRLDRLGMPGLVADKPDPNAKAA